MQKDSKHPAETPVGENATPGGPSELERRTITRRVFVVAGSGLLLSGVDACLSEGTRLVVDPPDAGLPAPEGTGVIRVSVGGLDGAVSGGSVTASRVDNTGTSVTRALPAPAGGTSAASLTDLTVGEYDVAYLAPMGFNLVDPSASPQTTSVMSGGTATVSFSVQGSTGSIRVNVNGLTGATSGGQVTATRVDNTGTPMVRDLPAPTSGVSSVNLGELSVGGYSVAYQPPAGFNVGASSPSPQAATVAAGASATVAFLAQVIPGVVRVTVTGLTGATSGGQVTLRRSDNTGTPVTLDLAAPTSDSTTGDLTNVAPGNYNATYTAPTGFELSPPSQSPQAVAVNAGGTSTANFFTSAIPTGTLRITVAGLLAGASSGGSATILRTDLAGQTPIFVNVPVSGSQDSILRTGTYSVTYSPPSGHQVAPGEINPRTDVALTVGQTTTIAYQVVQSQAPAGIVFSSDFSTGLGTSQNAISDGGKWNLLGGQGQEIVSSAGLNFPTANVLMVNALVVRSGFALNRKTGMPVPAAPFRRFYRWYYRHAKPFGPHPNQHPIQDGNSFSDVNWSLNINQLTDTTWTPSHEGGPRKRYGTTVVLQTNHTYRFELMVDALSATTWRLHIRVFDESGTQVLSDADYREVNNSNDLLADNPILSFNRIQNLDGMNCGCNGIHNMTANVVHSYQGGFAVSDTDWIGPYQNGV